MNNILLFLLPKKEVEYILNTYSIRQTVEKMDYHHYSAIPVLDKEGHYISTISDGDILRKLREVNYNKDKLENTKISDVQVLRDTKVINIEKTMDDLVEIIINQNFVPVVDDRNYFIGIVTRKSIIEYLSKSKK